MCDKTVVTDLKIAYIGGGSRGWAWNLMKDLASCDLISGKVSLYDIDYSAAHNNEIIGNRLSASEGCKSKWRYEAVLELSEALDGADFVVISILPGTFDEMESDVHTPEKYGIYQPVGDTTGPGGIIRSLRTVPMFETIGLAIGRYCPKAWVINYTNPMTVCTRTLYRVFPEIRAFGCCHEVFGTQMFLSKVIEDQCGIQGINRSEIKTSVTGVNHFTWLTSAHYHGMDLFPVYDNYINKYAAKSFSEAASNCQNNVFYDGNKVKMDLFRRFGCMAAAGDRHLVEFCPGNWYLSNPETFKNWGFNLTPIQWRKDDLENRLKRSKALVNGEQVLTPSASGEEGVLQMCALLGLGDLVTNVNLPNVGQIPNLPLGAVVETNALFRADSLSPVTAGPIPKSIYSLVAGKVGEQELVVEAGLSRDLHLAFSAFSCNSLVRIPLSDARALFNEMVRNTSSYLSDYASEI